MLKLWLLIIASGVIGSIGTQSLETYYEWKYIKFLWDTVEQKEWYRDNKKYVPENIVPIDVDRAKDGRVFITFVGGAGVPASVAVVTDLYTSVGPLVRPFPDWSWYNKTDCSGITSVYRVTIDDCNNMYVLDNGYVGDKYTCPAKILVFDLNNDKLVHTLEIPYKVSHNKNGKGLLVTPVVQTKRPNCEVENIFMADVNGYALVYWNRVLFRRLEGRAFTPNPSLSTVSINGEQFDMLDSLMGMALSKNILEQEGHHLIFRPFSSRALYSAETRVLERSQWADMIKYYKHQEFLPSQATTMAISDNGTLFLGLTTEMAIACWNRYRHMIPENLNIAVQDSERLQFVSGMKVLSASRTGKNEELWMLSNRYQKKATGTMKYNEINFRVLRSTVNELIKGTKCEQPQGIRKHKLYRKSIV